MRPKLDNPPTKAKILDAAESLVLKRGYSATTVDEVCGTAGVTKGSFFHYFPSKEALGKELISRFSCRTGQNWQQACCGGADPLERLYARLDYMKAAADDPAFKGCLVGTVTQEVSGDNGELRHLCARSFEEAVSTLEQDLTEARALYAPRSKVKPAELARFMLSVLQGSFVLMKAGKDRSVVRQNAEILKGYLRTIFGR